jgi:hypothetical protein
MISPEGQQPAQEFLQGATQTHFAHQRQHDGQEYE